MYDFDPVAIAAGEKISAIRRVILIPNPNSSLTRHGSWILSLANICCAFPLPLFVEQSSLSASPPPPTFEDVLDRLQLPSPPVVLRAAHDKLLNSIKQKLKFGSTAILIILLHYFSPSTKELHSD